MFGQWMAREHARKDSTLVGFWPLLDNTNDHSGRAMHASVQIVLTPALPPGSPGSTRPRLSRQYGMGGFNTFVQSSVAAQKAFYWLSCGNGVTTYTESRPQLDFHTADKFSLSIWFCRSATGNFSEGIVNASGGVVGLMSRNFYDTSVNAWRGWDLYVNDNTNTVHFSCGAPSLGAGIDIYPYSGLDVSVPLGKNLGRWVHVAVTYDGSATAAGVKMYLDGRPVQTTIVEDFLWFSGSPNPQEFSTGSSGIFRLGATQRDESYAVRVFEGVLALARVYSRRLNPSTVAAVYRREKALFFSPRRVGAPANVRTKSFTLFMRGMGLLNNSAPLYIFGITGDATHSVPLFIHGDGTFNHSAPLFVHGEVPVAGSAPLYIHGTTVSSASLPLVVQAVGTFEQQSASLYIDGVTPGHHGFQRGCSLFVNGDFPSRSLNLVLRGAPTARVVNNINLWVQGELASFSHSAPLVMWNQSSGRENGASLFIQGDGGLVGGLPFGDAMNLFLKRIPALDGSRTLVVHPGLGYTQEATLFVDGGLSLTAGRTLVLPHTYDRRSHTASLFVAGF